MLPSPSSSETLEQRRKKKRKIRQFAKLGLQIHRDAPISSMNLQHQYVRLEDFFIPIKLGLQMLQHFCLFAQQLLHLLDNSDLGVP
jgi:hypothetical protein